MFSGSEDDEDDSVARSDGSEDYEAEAVSESDSDNSWGGKKRNVRNIAFFLNRRFSSSLWFCRFQKPQSATLDNTCRGTSFCSTV